MIESGLINSEQLQEALREQKITKDFLGNILVRRGYIKESSLLEVLSKQFNIPHLRVKDIYINLALVRKFSYSLISKYKCFPVEQDEESVTVALSNPLDAVAIGELERAVAPLKLKVVLTYRRDIEEVIKRYRQYR